MNLLSRVVILLGQRWRFAGAERGSRSFHVALNFLCGRVPVSKHALRNPSYLLERRQGLAEIVERGAVVSVERLRAFLLHHERKIIVFSENALRRGYRST